MSIDKRKAVGRWLLSKGIRESVSPGELSDLQSLFGHKGFGILWSLIMFDRVTDMEELKSVNLSTEAGRGRGSTLQGQIRAIDRLHETLLEIADPQDGGQLTAGGEGQER